MVLLCTGESTLVLTYYLALAWSPFDAMLP